MAAFVPRTKSNKPHPRLETGEMTPWILAVLPGIAAVAAYTNTLRHGFVYDDINGILQNPVVTGFSGVPDLLALLSQPWRPVLFLSYALSHYLFGFDPRIFHLTNVLIHATNAVLVGAIAREAARLWMAENIAEKFALAAGLIFALHPLHSEAVAYVWGRSSSLCGMFYFTSLLAVMIACRKTGMMEHVLWGSGALIAGFLAWKTKEEAITLPLVIAGFLFLRGRRWTAAGMILTPILIVLFRYHDIVRAFMEVGENRNLVLAGALPGLKPGAYFLTHITCNVFYYFAKSVVPVGLNADPTIKTVTTIFDARFILAIICMTGLAVLCGVFIRRQKILSLGLWALLISPLAAYSFMPLADVVAEHRAYIAGLGFALVLASAVVWKPRYSGAIMMVVSLLFGSATIRRNQVWANSLSLWTDAERKSPALARPHLNLGQVYQERGRYEEALAEYSRALSANPRLTPALVNRGAVFFQRGELDRAESELKRAIEVSPERAVPYLNLASIALVKKRPEAALFWLEKSVAREETAFCRFTRGETLLQLGRYDEAVREYNRAAELATVFPELAARIDLRLDQLSRQRATR